MRLLKHIIILFLIVFSSCGKEDSKIYKFKTSLFASENVIPIVSFTLNEKNVNFILDTGSDITVINKDYFIKNSDHFEIVDSVFFNVNTINSLKQENTLIVQSFVNDSISVTFYVLDISKTVEDIFIKQQIKINGIIGNDFLYKNELILDFKNKTLSNI